MKYLIQNRKEFIISLGIFATILLIIIWSVWSIFTGNLDYKNLIVVAGGIFEILGWYYNMPTSEENCRYTGEMRLEKEYNKGIITGEDFYNEAENFDDENLNEEDFEENFEEGEEQ